MNDDDDILFLPHEKITVSAVGSGLLIFLKIFFKFILSETEIVIITDR